MNRIRRAEWKRLWSNPILWIGILVVLGLEIWFMSGEKGMHSEQEYWQKIFNVSQAKLEEWNDVKEGSDEWNALSEEDRLVISKNKKQQERATQALHALQSGDWNTEVELHYEQAKEALADYQQRPKSEQKEWFAYEREASYYKYLAEQKLPPSDWNATHTMADAILQMPDKISLIIGVFVVFLGSFTISGEKKKQAWNGFVIGGFSERTVVMAKWIVMIQSTFMLFFGNIIVLLAYAGIRYGIGDWNAPQVLIDSVLQFGRKTPIITIYEQLMWKLWIYMAYLIFMACFGVMLSALISSSIVNIGITAMLGGAVYLIENGMLAQIPSSQFYKGFLFQYGNTQHILDGSSGYVAALLLPIGAALFCFLIIWLCSTSAKRGEGEVVIETIEWITIPFLRGKTPVVTHGERWTEEDMERLARYWISREEKKEKQVPNWMILMPEPPFYPEMTMEANLRYYETIYGFSKEERRKLVEEMELSDALKIKMRNAPAVVYWKVWMAICHLKKPKLLIVDWPLIRGEGDLSFWKKWLNREVSVGIEVVMASDGKDDWETF